jgi:hypothetical protein
MKRRTISVALLVLLAVMVAESAVAFGPVTEEDKELAFIITIGAVGAGMRATMMGEQIEGFSMDLESGGRYEFDYVDLAVLFEEPVAGIDFDVPYTHISGSAVMNETGDAMEFDLRFDGGPVDTLWFVLTPEMNMTPGFGVMEVPAWVNGFETTLVINEDRVDDM